MHESPEHTHYKTEQYNGLFNWTVTYRPDSDIYLPYFGRRKRKESEKYKTGIDFAKTKSRQVLYISGNCDPYRE